MTAFLIRWTSPSGPYSIAVKGELIDAYQEAMRPPSMLCAEGEIFERVSEDRLAVVRSKKEEPGV